LRPFSDDVLGLSSTRVEDVLGLSSTRVEETPSNERLDPLMSAQPRHHHSIIDVQGVLRGHEELVAELAHVPVE